MPVKPGAEPFAADGSSTGGTITLDDGRQMRQLAIDWATGKIEFGDAS